MLTEIFGPYWGIPVGGIAFAVVAYVALRAESHRLDRKYGPEA